MNDAAKTFITALAAVASAAIIAVWLADHAEANTPLPAGSSVHHWATQTVPGTPTEQAGKPRG